MTAKAVSTKKDEVPVKRKPPSHPILPKTPSKRHLDDDSLMEDLAPERQKKKKLLLLEKMEAPDKLLAGVHVSSQETVGKPTKCSKKEAKS